MASGDRSADVVEDLMRRVADVAKSGRVFSLAKYFLHERERLAVSYRYVAHSPEHVSLALHAAVAEADRIAEAEGRIGMVRELTAAFLDAVERAKREEAWGDVYAADAVGDEDGFAEASALEAGSRWNPAS